MTAIVKPKPALEDFLKLPETEPASEFLDGEIIQKPMPQGEHSVLQGELCKTINQVAKTEKIAHAFPELYCTFGGASIVPDVAVFRRKKEEGRRKKEYRTENRCSRFRLHQNNNLDDVSASVPLATQIASGTLALHNSNANGFDMTNNPKKITIRNKSFEWGKRTYLMGVLNVTPDSFSDGGDFNTLESALAQAENMVKYGVDIIDIGGQSTRPGAAEISLAEEIDRVVPVVQMLRKKADVFGSVPISIDTTRAQVAQAAVEAGADIINDISGATFDSEMLSTVAKLQVPIILMHLRGTPQTMQKLTDYQDLIGEIGEFLDSRIAAALAAGIDKSQIIIDPGIGFAKNYSQNLEILRDLPKFRVLNCPILVGVSRKSFIGQILNQPEAKQRVWGTAAACTGAIANSADILRVHDVKEMRDVCQVADAIFRYQS